MSEYSDVTLVLAPEAAQRFREAVSECDDLVIRSFVASNVLEAEDGKPGHIFWNMTRWQPTTDTFLGYREVDFVMKFLKELPKEEFLLSETDGDTGETKVMGAYFDNPYLSPNITIQFSVNYPAL